MMSRIGNNVSTLMACPMSRVCFPADSSDMELRISIITVAEAVRVMSIINQSSFAVKDPADGNVSCGQMIEGGLSKENPNIIQYGAHIPKIVAAIDFQLRSPRNIAAMG